MAQVLHGMDAIDSIHQVGDMSYVIYSLIYNSNA